jgi:tetratricopeptide (TPR) repeat protein
MTASTHRTGRPRSADFATPLTIPGGAVAGAEIVRELPPEVALPAWQTLRSVLMWAAEEPGQRSDLFEPCAMADWERELLEGEWEPDLRVPLAVLVGELSRPSQAAPDAIAHACLCVADWALENNGVATALAFAEAAALSWPQNPRYAWMAGRLLRRNGRSAEAERWIRRCIKTAASNRDYEMQVLGLDSLGNLLHERGKNPQSIRTLNDALRLARRHRLREREGEILHDLFVVTTWVGETENAHAYARSAFEIYQPGHSRIPALVHDVALYWMGRGYFSRAYSVLQHLPPLFDLAEERIKVYGGLARAAAGCHDRDVYHEAAQEVWTLASDPRAQASVPAALLEIARGAATLREWEQAERAIMKSVEVATYNGVADVLLHAEQARDAIINRSMKDEARAAMDVRAAPQVDALAAGFLAVLPAPQKVGC